MRSLLRRQVARLKVQCERKTRDMGAIRHMFVLQMQFLQYNCCSAMCNCVGTIPHVCHRYHRQWMWRKLDHVEKFLEILQKVFILFHVEKLAVQMLNSMWRENLSNNIACGEKLTNMRHGWNMKTSKHLHGHGVVVWSHCCGPVVWAEVNSQKSDLAGSVLAHHSYKSSCRS